MGIQNINKNFPDDLGINVDRTALGQLNQARKHFLDGGTMQPPGHSSEVSANLPKPVASPKHVSSSKKKSKSGKLENFKRAKIKQKTDI